MTLKHYPYRRPQRPLWASQAKTGTTYSITYKPNQGQGRKEVIERFEHIVHLIRTSFTRVPHYQP